MGAGMIQLELSLKTATIGLQRYLETTKDWMLQLVNTHEETKRMHSVKKESSKFAVELSIETSMDDDLPSAIQAKNLKKKAKQEGLKKILELGKENLFTVNIQNVVNKLMLIKTKHTSGCVQRALRLKQKVL